MAKRDPRNPLMTAANKSFGPLSDNNLQSNYASASGAPPSELDYYDTPGGQEEVSKAMKLAAQNKMHAMNGSIPQSPQSWLLQAWSNLQKNYHEHVNKWNTMTDRDTDLKNNQMAWNVGHSLEKEAKRRNASFKSPTKNAGRGIQAGAPQPKPPQGGGYGQ